MLFVSLAFGTVAIAATIVTNMDLVAISIGAFINMSAQLCGTTVGQSIKRA